MGIYKKEKNWYIDYYFKGRRKRKKVGPSKKLAMQVLKDVQLKIAKKEYLGIYEEKKILGDRKLLFPIRRSHYSVFWRETNLWRMY